MEILYYKFTNNVKHEDRLDKHGKYIEFVDFENHFYPFLLKNQTKLEAIYILSNKYNDINESKLKKLDISYEKVTKPPIVKLIRYDLHNDKTRNFLSFYSSHNGELNAFYQFSNKDVINKIRKLIAEPFRSQILNRNNLRLSENDLSNLNLLINKIPKYSFLVSSGDDENEYFIFSNENHLNVILELLTINTM